MKTIASMIFMLAMMASASTIARAGIMDRLFDFADQYYAQNGVEHAYQRRSDLCRGRGEEDPVNSG